jgi:hypothetical protein
MRYDRAFAQFVYTIVDRRDIAFARAASTAGKPTKDDHIGTTRIGAKPESYASGGCFQTGCSRLVAGH